MSYRPKLLSAEALPDSGVGELRHPQGAGGGAGSGSGSPPGLWRSSAGPGGRASTEPRAAQDQGGEASGLQQLHAAKAQPSKRWRLQTDADGPDGQPERSVRSQAKETARAG